MRRISSMASFSHPTRVGSVSFRPRSFDMQRSSSARPGGLLPLTDSIHHAAQAGGHKRNTGNHRAHKPTEPRASLQGIKSISAYVRPRQRCDCSEDKEFAVGLDREFRRGNRLTDRKDRRTLASSSRFAPWEVVTIRSSSMSSARRLREGVPWMALGGLVGRERQSWAALSQPRTGRRSAPNPWGSRGQTLFCLCRDGMGM
jgi:hypothetical protein